MVARRIRIGTTAYSGPGDIVSGAIGWWGLRSYTLAAVGGNCVRLVRASDSAEQTFVTVAGGGVDLASITTFLSGTTGKVVTLFDQTGNGNDATQTSDASRPDFTFSVIGSLPGMTFDRTTPECLTTPSMVVGNQPWSESAVAKRTGDFTSFNGILVQNLGLYFTNAADLIVAFGGSTADPSAAPDNVMYGIQAVFNSTSSILNINGVADTVDAGSSGAGTTVWQIGANGTSSNGLTGNICECGLWPGLAFTSGNNTALFNNQDAYWGL